MTSSSNRLERVGDQIQKELALLIQREIKDPRLGMVTVTAVRLTREFEHAKVYVTVLGSDSQEAASLEVLHHAAGFLRKALGQRMKIRTIPQLHFVLDTSIETGARLTNLIEAAVAADKKDTN